MSARSPQDANLGSTWANSSPTWPILAAKMSISCWRGCIFGFSAICVLRRPRWLQDGPKRRPSSPKTAPRGSKMAPRGPKRRQEEPKTAPRRPQDGPKSTPSRLQVASKPQSKIIFCEGSPQEAPKKPQEPPRGLQEAPKSSQEAPKEPPRGPQEALKRPPQGPQEAPKKHPSTTFTLHFQASDRFATQTADCMKRGRRSFAAGVLDNRAR